MNFQFNYYNNNSFPYSIYTYKFSIILLHSTINFIQKTILSIKIRQEVEFADYKKTSLNCQFLLNFA